MATVPVIRGMLVVLLAVLSACSADPDNPEQKIRKMIDAGEEAVEARSIMMVLSFIAGDYQDKQGRRKEDMKRMVAGYILRNKSIHLLTRVQHVALNEDETKADVTLYVGMAGVPVASVDQLVFTRADLYRFDLVLVLEEGNWRVAEGNWHQARLEDF
ncbi:MAG: hypothetical protein GY792_35095 [Gammaproteobacteria bacterium]|nr:hypothetical protein [Gammaproteobacteria bacterium]